MAPIATTSEFYIGGEKKTLISACQYGYEMWMMRENDKLNLSCIPETQ
jgi:hypothetical protein